MPSQLRLKLHVANTSNSDTQAVSPEAREGAEEKLLEFQAALLPHLRTCDLSNDHYQKTALIRGLYGRPVISRDSNNSAVLRVQRDDLISIHPPKGEVLDRVYCHVDDQRVLVCPGDRRHYSVQCRQGFRDVLCMNGGEFDG